MPSMDPNTTIDAIRESLALGDTQAANDHHRDYAQWRLNGGFSATEEKLRNLCDSCIPAFASWRHRGYYTDELRRTLLDNRYGKSRNARYSETVQKTVDAAFKFAQEQRDRGCTKEDAARSLKKMFDSPTGET